MIAIYHICLMKRLEKEEKIIAPVYIEFMYLYTLSSRLLPWLAL